MQSTIKSLKGQRLTVTRNVVLGRQRDAFAVKPEWDSFSSPDLLELVTNYATAIGSPKEFLFFPLLTASASMLGRTTSIKLTELWSEPALLWTIVAARKGEKKSAAMRIICDAVRETESAAQMRFLQANPHFQPLPGEDLSDEAQEAIPIFSMTNSQFTFGKLHDQMARNDGECLLLYDEIAALYEQLDHQSGGSQCDRKILLSLYGGDAWSCASKSCGHNTIQRTHFNYTGFMQPTIAIAMLNMDDFDGFNDRHVAIVCPERNKAYFEDLVPLPATSPSIANILSLLRRQHHEENWTYELDAEAKEAFSTFYNELEDRMEKHSDNEDHRGVLSKAQGQTARLALVLHTLHSAVQHRDRPYEEFVTELTIRTDVIVWAINLMEFCIQQIFALMPPPVLETCETPEYDFNKVWETHPRNVKSLLEYDRQDFEPSFVAQRRLLPPQKQSQTSNNKYPTAAAKAYLSTIAEAGLGDMVEPSQSGSRKRSKTMVFRKRKFDDLEGDAKDILNSLDISKDAFDGKIRKTTDEQD